LQIPGAAPQKDVDAALLESREREIL